MREGRQRARASYLMFLPKAWNLSMMTLLNGNKYARCEMTSPKVCGLPLADVWGSQEAACLVQREREHAAHATSHRHGLRMPSKTGMDRIQLYEQPGRLALVALTHCNVQTGLGSKFDTVHSLPYGAAAYVFVQNFLKRLSNSSPNQTFPFVSIPQPQLHMFIQRNSLQWSDRSKTECPGPPDMV
jgi:hypothetical protein